MAILMVLLLLSLTVGLCYTAMRTQSTAGMIQRNCDRRGAARQAAITGLTMALKKMCRNDWAGVDTSLNGSINANDTFLVTYTTGDPRTTSNDPTYPYRVTLLSTGYSMDPIQPQAVSIYRSRAVVQLIPRKLADEPADWATMLAYTAYQWAFGSFTMAVPARIEGPVRVQAIMNLDWNYNWWGHPRDNYHKDLRRMQLAGRGDYRPFNSSVTLDTGWQFIHDTVNVLRNDLGVTVNDASNRTATGMTFPNNLATYRLYPGGKQYTVPQLPGTIQASTYQADPATNPAGIFFRHGTLILNDDAVIRGTVVTPQGSGLIFASGKRVRLEAINLPPLQGTTTAVQLPAAMVGDSFLVGQNADIAVTGLVSVYNRFQIAADDFADTQYIHKGKLIAQDILFEPRSNWYQNSIWWGNHYIDFHDQEYNVDGYNYFPEYMAKSPAVLYKLDYTNRLLLKPDTATVRYHWHFPQNTIYDYETLAGVKILRWDLLDWAENL